MTDSALAALRAHAEAGDIGAMTAYGKHLLLESNSPAQQQEGARLVARAAEAGNGEALAQQAILVAAGIFNAFDWERALDLLVLAAARGWTPAQADIRFLSGAGGDDFVALRRSIDVAAWIRPPSTTVVFKSPHITTVQGLMSKAECARMIAKVRDRLSRANVYDAATGGKAVVGDRSNSTAVISLADYEVSFVLLLARMSILLGLPANFFEAMNVLHYKPGEEFKPHFDFLSSNEPGLAADIHSNGQRIVTLLVYLNEDYEGGETQFPRLNYAFRGRTGDALMFGNVDAQGKPAPLTLHAGLPPRSGEKWLLSQWVRSRPLGPK